MLFPDPAGPVIIQICWTVFCEDFSVFHMLELYEELWVKAGLGMSLAAPFIAWSGRSPADSILNEEREREKKRKERAMKTDAEGAKV